MCAAFTNETATWGRMALRGFNSQVTSLPRFKVPVKATPKESKNTNCKER
jgi:hypothetical protein